MGNGSLALGGAQQRRRWGVGRGSMGFLFFLFFFSLFKYRKMKKEENYKG
jgi:hypothetical protein